MIVRPRATFSIVLLPSGGATYEWRHEDESAYPPFSIVLLPSGGVTYDATLRPRKGARGGAGGRIASCNKRQSAGWRMAMTALPSGTLA